MSLNLDGSALRMSSHKPGAKSIKAKLHANSEQEILTIGTAQGSSTFNVSQIGRGWPGIAGFDRGVPAACRTAAEALFLSSSGLCFRRRSMPIRPLSGGDPQSRARS